MVKIFVVGNRLIYNIWPNNTHWFCSGWSYNKQTDLLYKLRQIYCINYQETYSPAAAANLDTLILINLWIELNDD